MNIDNNDKRPECLAFVTDDSSVNIIKKIFSNFELKNSSVIEGSVDYAKQYIKSHELPKLLILDISSRDVPMKDLTEISSLIDPSIKIAIISDQNDINFFRDIINIGVEDYFVKPLHIIPLERLFTKTFKPNEFSKNQKLFQNGILIGIFGSKGGIGASTIALNTGIILAKEKKKKTLILDTNIYNGTINSLLDIHQDTSYIDILKHSESEIDDYIFSSMITKTEYDKLSLMCGTKGLGESDDISYQQFDLLLKKIKNNFNYTIIDINPNHKEIINAIANNLDIMFVMSELTIPSAINTSKIINFQKSKKLNTIINVVLNNFGENSKGAIQQKIFEKAISMNVQHIIDFEPNIVKSCENTGVPIAENKSGKIYKNIQNIVRDILLEGIHEKFNIPKKNIFKRMLIKIFRK